MRTHFLQGLELQGQGRVLQEIPGFDFYQLREVERLKWASREHDLGSATLTLVMLYGRSGETLRLQLTCINVQLLKLPSLNGFFFVSELEIEDLRSDQQEGIRYRVKDYGESEFEVLCGDVRLSSA